MTKNLSRSLESNNQVVLSYELLALLNWMIQNEAPVLKQMIAKAMASGLRANFAQSNFAAMQTPQEAHDGIVEFFGSLEALMLDVINEQSVQTALEKNLMPAIDHIDGTACDDETVRASIIKATSEIQRNPNENPHEALFKELLKQWRPGSKKKVVH